MAFTKGSIEQLGRLARLPIHAETCSIQSELTNILHMVDQITGVEVEGTLPMAHPLEHSQPLRSDEVTEPDQRDVLMRLAPEAEAGLYRVPPVIEA